VDSEQAQQKFKQADMLFKQGQFDQALDILSELNQAFPNTKNIMYPAALCMEKLGRIEEAKHLCHSMIRQFDSEKARELLNQLEVAPRIAVQVDTGSESDLDDLFALKTQGAPPAPATSPDGSKRNLYIIIGVVAVVAVLAILPFVMGKAGINETTPEGTITVHDGETVTIGEDGAVNVTSSTGESAPVSLGEQNMQQFEQLMNKILGYALLAGIGFYLLGCYLMLRICRNAGSDPGFLIWVPVVQLIVLSQPQPEHCPVFLVSAVSCTHCLIPPFGREFKKA
jgi:tetratricopeptide (TPR) repeat protein